MCCETNKNRSLAVLHVENRGRYAQIWLETILDPILSNRIGLLRGLQNNLINWLESLNQQ